MHQASSAECWYILHFDPGSFNCGTMLKAISFTAFGGVNLDKLIDDAAVDMGVAELLAGMT